MKTLLATSAILFATTGDGQELSQELAEARATCNKIDSIVTVLWTSARNETIPQYIKTGRALVESTEPGLQRSYAEQAYLLTYHVALDEQSEARNDEHRNSIASSLRMMCLTDALSDQQENLLLEPQ
jgi:hypothetical protein